MIKDINKALEHIHGYSVLPDTREIFLNPKDDESETDISLATGFIKNLTLLESINKNNIIIHHFNHGGYWNAAFAIYDSIKNSPCHITMVCHGEVMSAGILILQAADLRLSMNNCEFLIHEGSTGINENLSHKQASSWAVTEKHKEELIYDILTEKCMKGPFFVERQYKKNRVKGFLKTKLAKLEDWILFPKEAIEYGFIDDIIGSNNYPNLDTIRKN